MDPVRAAFDLALRECGVPCNGVCAQSYEKARPETYMHTEHGTGVSERASMMSCAFMLNMHAGGAAFECGLVRVTKNEPSTGRDYTSYTTIASWRYIGIAQAWPPSSADFDGERDFVIVPAALLDLANKAADSADKCIDKLVDKPVSVSEPATKPVDKPADKSTCNTGPRPSTSAKKIALLNAHGPAPSIGCQMAEPAKHLGGHAPLDINLLRANARALAEIAEPSLTCSERATLRRLVDEYALLAAYERSERHPSTSDYGLRRAALDIVGVAVCMRPGREVLVHCNSQRQCEQASRRALVLVRKCEADRADVRRVLYNVGDGDANAVITVKFIDGAESKIVFAMRPREMVEPVDAFCVSSGPACLCAMVPDEPIAPAASDPGPRPGTDCASGVWTVEQEIAVVDDDDMPPLEDVADATGPRTSTEPIGSTVEYLSAPATLRSVVCGKLRALGYEVDETRSEPAAQYKMHTGGATPYEAALALARSIDESDARPARPLWVGATRLTAAQSAADGKMVYDVSVTYGDYSVSRSKIEALLAAHIRATGYFSRSSARRHGDDIVLCVLRGHTGAPGASALDSIVAAMIKRAPPAPATVFFDLVFFACEHASGARVSESCSRCERGEWRCEWAYE